MCSPFSACDCCPLSTPCPGYIGHSISQYTVTFEQDNKKLRTIQEPKIYETRYSTPWLRLWELGDGDWLNVVRRLAYAHQAKSQVAVQAAVPLEEAQRQSGIGQVALMPICRISAALVPCKTTQSSARFIWQRGRWLR